jgi:hypothetical protein
MAATDVSAPISSDRTRDNNGQNEKNDISRIVNDINTSTPNGIRIKEEFTLRFPGHTILSAKNRTSGNRSTHYDFTIVAQSPDETVYELRVEHKGSISRKKGDDSDYPWKAGVQFFNGGCEKFSICKIYAKLWHMVYIESEYQKDTYGLTSPIPTFEEWYDKDCKTQANPKTDYGKELKQKIRQLYGPKASLLDDRKHINAIFKSHLVSHPHEGILKTLQTEMTHIVNKVLEEKQCWLVIYGNLDGEFDIAWYDKYTINIIDIVCNITDKDIWFKFIGEDGTSFEGILRWGKGAGFSNLRLDAR